MSDRHCEVCGKAMGHSFSLRFAGVYRCDVCVGADDARRAFVRLISELDAVGLHDVASAAKELLEALS